MVRKEIARCKKDIYIAIAIITRLIESIIIMSVIRKFHQFAV
jgi:hypothetical protein